MRSLAPNALCGVFAITSHSLVSFVLKMLAVDRESPHTSFFANYDKEGPVRREGWFFYLDSAILVPLKSQVYQADLMRAQALLPGSKKHKVG